MTIYDDPIVQKTISPRSDFKIKDLVYGERPMSLYLENPAAGPGPPSPARTCLGPPTDLHSAHGTARKRPAPSAVDVGRIPGVKEDSKSRICDEPDGRLQDQTLSDRPGHSRRFAKSTERTESITDNCYIKAAFQTDNLMTCKSLSELSGNMTIEKETSELQRPKWIDSYLKHIFRSVEQVAQRPLITVDEIRRMKPPRKATNDPDSRIIEPGDMLIFINGVAPIYGTQSLSS